MNTIEVTYLHEAQDFMFSIDEAASKKLAYNIGKVCLGIKDKDIFSKLGDTDIWEFRALHNGMCYRLFSFWDTNANSLIIATHGIVKKSQKTPKQEIVKAEAIRFEYMNQHK